MKRVIDVKLFNDVVLYYKLVIVKYILFLGFYYVVISGIWVVLIW